MICHLIDQVKPKISLDVNDLTQSCRQANQCWYAESLVDLIFKWGWGGVGYDKKPFLQILFHLYIETISVTKLYHWYYYIYLVVSELFLFGYRPLLQSLFPEHI